MTYIRNGEGVPVRLINKMMRAAEKVMWDRGIHYAAGIIDYGVARAMGTFGRSRYEKRGDFQKENGEMQTLFWKDLKKVESHLMNGEDDCPWFRIEPALIRNALINSLHKIINFRSFLLLGLFNTNWQEFL